MRLDGYSSSYPLDRSARPSNASNSRDVQRESLPRAQENIAVSPESTPQLPPVERPNTSAANRNELFPAYAREPVEAYQKPMSNRAAQALASYGSTANMASEFEPMQVLGLDLYA